MNLTNQLMQYSEQERLALISCITSIAPLDKVANQDEINFVLALIEAADLDALKMKTLIDTAEHPKIKEFQDSVEPGANKEDSAHFFKNEVLPSIRYNREIAKKTNQMFGELKIDMEKTDSDQELENEARKLIEGSSLENMVLSLYLR
ncbi:MAG TPA: hypothetical protein VFF27_12935 [Bacteroidia bacterium]|jgi:hypothetical protein|nr:hypothetical protein [Bacteroidia bacterium]